MTPPTRTHQSRRRQRWKWWTRQSAAVSSSESGRRTLLDTNDGPAAPHTGFVSPAPTLAVPLARKTAESKSSFGTSETQHSCLLVGVLLNVLLSRLAEFNGISFRLAVEKHSFYPMLFRKSPPNANKLIGIVLRISFLCRNCHVFSPGVASITKPQKNVLNVNQNGRSSNSSEHTKIRTVFLFKAWLKHSQRFFLTLFSFFCFVFKAL